MLFRSEGLSHNYIRAIAEDNNDNFWISTDHGITQIISVDPVLSNGNRYLCYPYYNEDGIGSLVFNNHSILCHSTGVIIMGGIGGYLVINTKPSNFYSNINNQIVFTSLFINNETIDAGNKISDGRIILPKNIQLLNNIILNYSDTNFAIDVSSMDYQNQHKKQFVYRFGDNEEWVKAETNRIHFNKLSPGIYNLEVKVKESNNLRNNPVSTLTIIVQPPLWLSLPAYFIYFIIVCLIIFSYIKYLKRKHEQMLIKQKEKLEAIQLRETNEAKMQFFTNVSHDLRTPLTGIITPLEILTSLDFPPSRKEELRLVHRNAMILQNEVNQLLEFRKYEQQQVILNPSYSNLSVFINEICNSYRQIFNQNKIVFNIDIIDKEIETAFDNNKMERIILNILSNAIKYNKENGSVTILVDSVTINNDIFARIMVADTGIGIKDENKQKVFERFFQEDNATRTYAGSGIGLHIVNEYVKLHNGTVTIKDNKPEGTIFIIDIPITEKPHSDEVLQPEKTESVKKENILIVEDNSDFRKFIAGCLIEKYNVFEASNGKDALDVLSENFINIVVSDIMMAEMDGIELCQRMKTNISFSHIPIILISARSEDEHILSGLREGADEYITKPFNLEILLLKITKLLKWSALNHEKFKTLDVPTSDISLSNLDKKLIDKTIHIIAQNMDNSEFSVEDLSSEVGMSRSNLYKKLISVTGKSPIEFIRAIRLKEGRILLEKKEFTISEVAYKVGLSPKQFAKYFKDEFGCLPSEYEKSETLES